MDFELTEEQRELQGVVRDVTGRECTTALVRAASAMTPTMTPTMTSAMTPTTTSAETSDQTRTGPTSQRSAR